VRELLIRPRRFAEIRRALPGVAANLLTERLQTLASAGIVDRVHEPGRKAVEYALTPRGAALREPVLGLVRWGAATMGAGPRTGEAVQPQWVRLAAEALVAGRRGGRSGTLAIAAGGEAFALDVGPAGWAVRDGVCTNPDATLSGPPAAILGLLAGALDAGRARAAGLVFVDPDGVAAAAFPA
jgi:DNA-binding HxlR family transcriptional regulator